MDFEFFNWFACFAFVSSSFLKRYNKQYYGNRKTETFGIWNRLTNRYWPLILTKILSRLIITKEFLSRQVNRLKILSNQHVVWSSLQQSREYINNKHDEGNGAIYQRIWDRNLLKRWSLYGNRQSLIAPWLELSTSYLCMYMSLS